MAGSWRVVAESVRELDNPKYRVGDFTKMLISEEHKITNVAVQVALLGKSERYPQTSKPFNVDDSGSATVDQVLFVPRPSPKETVVVRVVKHHKVQKDALIGEAHVMEAKGRQRLELMRGGKPRGSIMVNITDGIPQPPPQLPVGTPNKASGSSVMQPPPTSSRGSALQAPSSTGGRPGSRSPSAVSPRPSAAASAPKQAAAPPGKSSGTAGNAAASCFGGCLDCMQGLISGTPTAQAQAAFLAKKRTAPDVQRRPSGLLYRVIRTGMGRHHPAEDMQCDCHYRGKLINGKEFDSSYKDNKPASFAPRQVIKGWSEALQLMVEGDMWELYVPPELGYGDRGVEGVIPGGAVLVFQIELVKIRGR